MKRFLILLYSIVACTAMLNSQQLNEDKTFIFDRTNNVQLEGGGIGIFYSVMYEKIIFNQHRFKTNINVGGAYYGEEAGVLATALFYTNVNEIYSISSSHHLEVGIGLMGLKENEGEIPEFFREDNYIPFLSGRIGYRYQKPEGKLLLRVACTPLIESFRKTQIYPWPAASIGYTF